MSSSEVNTGDDEEKNIEEQNAEAQNIEAIEISGTPPLKMSTPNESVSAKPPLYAVNAVPRAGGYLKGLPSGPNVTSARSSKSMDQTKSHASMSVFYAKSRDQRINLVLEDSEWNLGESQLDICTSDTLADNILAVTISCVMLMAADVDEIPEEYLIFAENYLSCIKDDSNYHPPNVQGILNHIAYLRETTNRKRELKVSCKCAPMEDSDGCDATQCANRLSSKMKHKRSFSSSKCRIPVRMKSYSPKI